MMLGRRGLEEFEFVGLHDGLGELCHGLTAVLALSLEEAECFRLAHAASGHEDSFGAFDQFAIAQGGFERRDVVAKFFVFLHARHGDLDGGVKAGRGHRLKKIAGDAVLRGLIDEIGVSVSREDDNGRSGIERDLSSGLKAVEPGHFDVHEDKVGQRSSADFNGAMAVVDNGDDVVSEFFELALQARGDLSIVIGDQDFITSVHTLPFPSTTPSADSSDRFIDAVGFIELNRASTRRRLKSLSQRWFPQARVSKVFARFAERVLTLWQLISTIRT